MPISRTDWLRAQLQAQLQRRTHAAGTKLHGSETLGASNLAAPLMRVRALKSRHVHDKQLLASALLHDLLCMELGEGLDNDPEFHQALQTILADLQADADLWKFCLQCIADV